MPAGAQQGPPPATPDPSIADGSAQRALDRARARWKRLKIRSYDFQVRQVCFCPDTDWVTIRVRRGSPSKGSRKKARALASVPRLFRQIQLAIDRPVHRLNLRYGARGVPVTVFTDPIEYAVDDEGGYDVRRFKRRGRN